MKKGIILILLAMILGACAAAPQPTPDPTVTPTPKIEETLAPTPAPNASVNANPADMSAYEGFDDTLNVFVEISLEDSLSKMEQGESFLIYYGKPNCPWCVEAIPLLNQAAKEKGVLVYYVDTSKSENYSEAMFDTLIHRFEGWLLTNEEGEESFYVPDVALILKGQVASNHISTVDTHDPYLGPMTDAEQTQLKEIYAEMIESLKAEN